SRTTRPWPSALEDRGGGYSGHRGGETSFRGGNVTVASPPGGISGIGICRSAFDRLNRRGLRLTISTHPSKRWAVFRPLLRRRTSIRRGSSPHRIPGGLPSTGSIATSSMVRVLAADSLSSHWPLSLKSGQHVTSSGGGKGLLARMK